MSSEDLKFVLGEKIGQLQSFLELWCLDVLNIVASQTLMVHPHDSAVESLVHPDAGNQGPSNEMSGGTEESKSSCGAKREQPSVYSDHQNTCDCDMDLVASSCLQSCEHYSLVDGDSVAPKQIIYGDQLQQQQTSDVFLTNIKDEASEATLANSNILEGEVIDATPNAGPAVIANEASCSYEVDDTEQQSALNNSQLNVSNSLSPESEESTRFNSSLYDALEQIPTMRAAFEARREESYSKTFPGFDEFSGGPLFTSLDPFERGGYAESIASRDRLNHSMELGDIRNTDLVPTYPCFLCKKTFRRPWDARRHENSIHFGQRFRCVGCSKNFSYSHHLRRHERHCQQALNASSYDSPVAENVASYAPSASCL